MIRGYLRKERDSVGWGRGISCFVGHVYMTRAYGNRTAIDVALEKSICRFVRLLGQIF